MIGVMKYIAPFDVPTQSPYAALAYGATQSPWKDVISAGNDVAVSLNSGYKKLDEIDEDAESTTISSGQIVYGRWFGTVIRHRFSLTRIYRQRIKDMVNEYAVFKALNQAVAQKTVMIFYPDFINFPNESVGLITKKRHSFKRYREQEIFMIDFDFYELGQAQVPKLIPQFV